MKNTRRILVERILRYPTLKIDLSDHPFIKYDIFEVNANFPKRGTPIGFVIQYCGHNNMSYLYQQANNNPWYHEFPDRNRTNVWILGICRKELITVQQVSESISSHQLTGNATGCMSSQPSEIRTLSGQIVNKIGAYSIKLDTYRTLGTKYLAFLKNLK